MPDEAYENHLNDLRWILETGLDPSQRVIRKPRRKHAPRMPSPTAQLWTVRECATYLRVADSTVIKWFGGRRGVIDVGTEENLRRHKRRYRRLRIPHAEVLRFLKENRIIN